MTIYNKYIQTTFDSLRNMMAVAKNAQGLITFLTGIEGTCCPIFALQLTAIFNCSLHEGKLPNEWKMANAIRPTSLKVNL